MPQEVTEPFRALIDSVTQLDPVNSGYQPQPAQVELSAPTLRAPTEQGLGDRTGRVANGRAQSPLRTNRVTRVTPFNVEAITDPRKRITSIPTGPVSPALRLKRLRHEAMDVLVDAAAAASMSDRRRAQNLLRAAASLRRPPAHQPLNLPRPRR